MLEFLGSGTTEMPSVAPSGPTKDHEPVGTGGGRTVTVALADFVESTVLTAVTVTPAGDGTAPGAVKSPEELMVPAVLLPPTTPFTSQFTAELEEPVTVRVNCSVYRVMTLAEFGLIETVIGGRTMVRTVEADFVESCKLTAETLTVFGLGTAAGAV